MGELSDTLDNYARQNPVRFHMPGNKGRISRFNFDMSADVTELPFTDNLYNPDGETGIIYRLEDKIAACFFPDTDCVHSVISCGGATLCIQGALLTLARLSRHNREKFLICDRASHISLINALALLNITPLWICSGNACEFISRAEDYIKIYGNAVIGAFVTSPDYYGKMKDIKAISGLCKKYSVPLVTDNSHGSHLAFHKDGELHPIKAGADISVDSVHKTLPALTGAAILHTAKKFDKEI
jgi:arginine/lysine/ornithine decarboxylase